MFTTKDSETPTERKKELIVIISELNLAGMKPTISGDKTKKMKSNGVLWDDDNVRYKLNTSFTKEKIKEKKPASPKIATPRNNVAGDANDNALYKFPNSKLQAKRNRAAKTKLKVKFWSGKANKAAAAKDIPSAVSSKNTNVNAVKTSSPKLRQKVSFLPPPVFTEQHVPMLTVPDDLTVHFNEEEANDLLITTDSLNIDSTPNTSSSTFITPKKSSHTLSHNPQNSPRSVQKRKRDQIDIDSHNDTDLEYFAKYVVQKLRKMETNQRIYSENLINTVLMLGQLQKLNGKSKVSDT